MGKKRRGHPNVEEILSRPWCYYCERDFEDLKLLISHQKAKHFKCDRCGRRLNTAGGLSVHLNQVHKENLEHVENALPNRKGLDVEIFGMEGMPQEILDQHRTRIIQNFYQAQEDRRLATGNPAPGQGVKNSRKKIRVETADELLKRLAEYRAMRHAIAANGGSMEDVVPTPEAPAYDAASQAQPPQNQPSYGYSQSPDLPQRPPGALAATAANLPQRPTQGFWADSTAPAQTDDIDQMIRMAEAGIKPPNKEDDGDKKAGKKDKDKKGRMIYDDAEFSPEERIAALPRYAFQPEVGA